MSMAEYTIDKIEYGGNTYKFQDNVSGYLTTIADELEDYGIEIGAQENILEGIQVNGTDLTIDSNKKVNVLAVSGVKGNAESTYRTGNVNLTPANVGAVQNSYGSLTGVFPQGFVSDSAIKVGISGYIKADDEATSDTLYLFGARKTAPVLYDDTTDTVIWTGYTTLNKPTAADVGALPITGGTLTGSLSVTDYVLLITPKSESSTSGWDRGFRFRDATNSTTIGGVGMLGNADTITYTYLGTNLYNGNNLRVYPDGKIWATGWEGNILVNGNITVKNGSGINSYASDGATVKTIAYMTTADDYIFGSSSYNDSSGTVSYRGNGISIVSKGAVVITAPSAVKSYGNITVQKTETGAEPSLIVEGTAATAHKVGLIIGGSSRNGGIWDYTNNKWVVYSSASGDVTLNGTANYATYAGYTQSSTGGLTIAPYQGNEVNFGGTDTQTSIYFGYRAYGSKSVPTDFYFGGSGTAKLHCNDIVIPVATTDSIYTALSDLGWTDLV